ncbi:MAG: hypothetical protein K2W99_06905 [Chthoniobacterales bacterium]|nr:hypothetical protein [Chthoniobacterales bacterium]
MSTTILPDLQAAVLCEDIRTEASGQQTLVGVLGALPVVSLPVAFLKLCLWTRWCGGEGDFSQRAVLLDPEEDKPLAEAKIDFTLNTMNAHATNVHFFGGVYFQRYGVYSIEIYLDEELQLRIPFPIVQVQLPNAE